MNGGRAGDRSTLRPEPRLGQWDGWNRRSVKVAVRLTSLRCVTVEYREDENERRPRQGLPNWQV